MSKNITIEVNLSIDKSGGAEKLPVVIEEMEKTLKERYPEAQIIVRKGYFQTIDGIAASDDNVERDVRFLLDAVRNRVLY